MLKLVNLKGTAPPHFLPCVPIDAYLSLVHREREGSDYDEEQMNEAISSQQNPVQDVDLDHSDVEDNTVLKEYDLDNYDYDGEGI